MHWLLIAVVVALASWILWGQTLYAKYKVYKQNQTAIRAVEGAGKIVTDVIGVAGELKGVADSLTHGQGDFFSRATGAFSQVVN